MKAFSQQHFQNFCHKAFSVFPLYRLTFLISCIPVKNHYSCCWNWVCCVLVRTTSKLLYLTLVWQFQLMSVSCQSSNKMSCMDYQPLSKAFDQGLEKKTLDVLLHNCFKLSLHRFGPEVYEAAACLAISAPFPLRWHSFATAS